MTTFSQDTQGPANTGIGDQRQITRDNSYVETTKTAVASGLNTAKEVHGAVGHVKGVDAVVQAQKTVDQEAADSEEYMRIEALGDTASIADVARQSELLTKNVARGRMTRENARLRVADLVSKSIEESPIFASEIRQSAGNLLGFDPKSEAARQFFGAYKPAGTDKLSALDKKANFISESTGQPVKTVRKALAESMMAESRLSTLKDQLALEDIEVDDYIAESTAITYKSSMNDLYGSLSMKIKEQGSVDLLTWNKEVADAKKGYISASLVELSALGYSGRTVLSKLNEQANLIYDPILETTESYDTNKVTARYLERKVQMAQIFASEANPVMFTIKHGYGERMASQVFDLLASSEGNESRLNLLKKTSGIGQFVNLAQMSREQFAKFSGNVMAKLGSPEGRSKGFTEEEAAVIDGVLGSMLPTMDGEDRSTVQTLLDDAGMPNKARSVIIGENKILVDRSKATPDTVRYVKHDYELIKNNNPKQIAAILGTSPAFVSVGKDGTIVLDSGKMGSGQGGRNVPVRPQTSDAYDKVQQINAYLRSDSWGKELGINKTTAASSFVAEIQRMEDLVDSMPDIEQVTMSGRTRNKTYRRPTLEEAMQFLSLPDQEAELKKQRYEYLLKKKAGELDAE